MKDNKKISLLKMRGTLNPNSAKVLNQLFLENGFFDADDIVQTKYEMLRSVRKQNITVKEASESFGFSRPAFYQAQSCFDQEGLAGLFPKKRGPKNRHKITEEIMQFVNNAMAETHSLDINDVVNLIKERYDL